MHKSVLVIGEAWEEQLKPFEEVSEKDDPRCEFKTELLEYELDKAFKDDLQRWREDATKRYHLECPKCGCSNSSPDEKLLKEEVICNNWHKDSTGKNSGNEKFKLTDVTEQERKDELKRLDEKEKAGAVAWANNMYSYHIEGKGWGYYTNPNGKWDGYSVGGRYSGYFRLKNGAKGNIGKRSWLCSED